MARNRKPQIISFLDRSSLVGPLQMGVLRFDLFMSQDAPDGGPSRLRIAFTVPALGVLRCRIGVGLMTLIAMVLDPPLS